MWGWIGVASCGGRCVVVRRALVRVRRLEDGRVVVVLACRGGLVVAPRALVGRGLCRGRVRLGRRRSGVDCGSVLRGCGGGASRVRGPSCWRLAIAGCLIPPVPAAKPLFPLVMSWKSRAYVGASFAVDVGPVAGRRLPGRLSARPSYAGRGGGLVPHIRGWSWALGVLGWRPFRVGSGRVGVHAAGWLPVLPSATTDASGGRGRRQPPTTRSLGGGLACPCFVLVVPALGSIRR